MDDQSQDRFEKLTQRADALQGSVIALVEQRRVDTRKRRIDRRMMVGLAVSVIIDIALTILLATVVNDQRQTDRRLSQALHQNYLTAQQQMDIRIRVLCPTETVLLELLSLPRATDAPPLSDRQRQALTGAIQTFKNSYAEMNCTPADGTLTTSKI